MSLLKVARSARWHRARAIQDVPDLSALRIHRYKAYQSVFSAANRPIFALFAPDCLLSSAPAGRRKPSGAWHVACPCISKVPVFGKFSDRTRMQGHPEQPFDLRRAVHLFLRGATICAAFFSRSIRRMQKIRAQNRPFGGVLTASTECSRSDELVMAIRGGGQSLCGDSFWHLGLSTFQARKSFL